jgi:A/G-specific adenine glycosylase
LLLQCHHLMGELSESVSNDRKVQALEISRSLLAWWEVQGRKDHALNPWMFTLEGKWPEPCEQVNPYPIHGAEVMRAARQYS